MEKATQGNPSPGKKEAADKRALWSTQISPLQRLNAEEFDKAGLEVFIKRDDLLTPYGGNKWRKLKYNFLEIMEKGYSEFLTFGGPFSNHVFASATLAKQHHLKATIFIRGAVDDFENPVLIHARNCGVKLKGLNRKTYATRYSPEFISRLKVEYPSAYVIPEGGANKQGLKGCEEIVTEAVGQLASRPDFWIVAAGTGNTASGIASQLRADEKVIAIAALRSSIMRPAWETSNGMISESAQSHLILSNAFSFGGVAKWNDELVSFMKKFELRHGILLDPIYTGKAMYGLFALAAAGKFRRASSIVFAHTGGMPGRMGFNYRYGDLLPDLVR
jgi:1-aminocyclopropane-1-carboxylate deaminase/D-cysteine desulfhydrase-like pyridoxal-dependent ACC family enzyme